MVLGILNPILKPLLNLAIPAATPAPASTPTPATTTSTVAVVQAAAASQQAVRQAAETPPVASASQSSPAVAQTEGVKFDLSDKALQLVEASAATQSTAPQAPAAQASAAATAPAPGSGWAFRPAAASVPATTEPVASVSETAADQPTETADPTEEDRARAWAIRGMEREQLLNLVDTLKVTPKADPAQKEVAEHAAAQPSVQAAPASQRGAA